MTKKTFLLLIIPLMFFISACNITNTKQSNPPTIVENNNFETQYEVGSVEPDWLSAITVTDEIDGEIPVTPDDIDKTHVDMNTVGTFDVIYTITNSKKISKTKIITITIVDTTSPTIQGLEEMILEVGSSEPDWFTDVSVTDNYDWNITLTVDNVDASNVNFNEIGTYQAVYTVFDSNHNEVTESRTVTIVDNTNPVITLIGEESSVCISQEYIDPGATALDNQIDDMTSDIMISSNVDTSVLGDYTVTYTVTDPSGNEASVNRVVHVVDDIMLMIEDVNLQIVILNALDKVAGPITKIEASTITTLEANSLGITSLLGIEHLTNLSVLNLSDNEISDLTPLSSLTALENVELLGNSIDLIPGSSNHTIIQQFIDNDIVTDLNGFIIADDHSDLPTSATNIDLMTHVVGSIDYLYDIDYFTFTLSSSSDITIFTLNDIEFTVYDSQFNILYESDDTLAYSDELNSGLYYIKIESQYVDSAISYLMVLEDDKQLSFSDMNFEQVIRTELNIPYGPIFPEDVLQLEVLSAPNSGITSIDGIENLVNLKEVVLYNNQISDISSLETLNNLEIVVLVNNPIDVSVDSSNYQVVMNFINYNVACDLNGQFIEDDYSDIKENATTIELNTSLAGTNSYSLDSDYFVFNLNTETEISIGITPSNENFYILYGENIDYTILYSEFAVFNLQPGTYYIRVITEVIDEPINYELSLNEFTDTEVHFADVNLELAIRDKLGIYDRSLYLSDVYSIYELDAANSLINDLTGIEYLVNLASLDLQYNNITDITPLLLLSNLNFVRLENNFINITFGNENYNVLQSFIDNDIVCDLNGLIITDDHSDIFGEATSIMIGNTATGNLDYLFDKDYFTFTITEYSLIDVLINSNNGLDLNIYDEYNGFVYIINNNSLLSLEPGTYTICVSGDTTVNYDITIIYHTPQEVYFDDFNLEQAIKDQLGIDYAAPLYDEDVLSITYLDGSNYEIGSIDGIGSLVNLVELRLENNEITDITPLYDLPNLHSVFLENNDIVIVEGNDNDAVIDYFIVNAIYCDIIPDDYGNSFDSATNISINNSISGTIESYYDEDYFTFTLTETKIVNIYSVSLGNEYNLHIEANLFNTNQDWITYEDISNRSIIVSLEPGTYYIKIAIFDAYGDYELFLEETTPVSLNNLQLEQAIKNELGIDNRELTEMDLLSMDYLCASDYGITDLTGIEQLINLEYLNLMENNIQDISPIASLINLTQLELSDNEITNIAALQSLTQLTTLELSNNQVTNIDALQNLSNLEFVILMGNQITDITPLDNLPSLDVVILVDNPIDVTEGTANYDVVINFIARNVMCDLNGLFIEDDYSDLPENATPITLNSTTEGIHNYALDSDYFVFTLPVASTVSIELTQLNENIYILYDENFQNLTFTSGFSIHNLQAGIYYIRVASAFTSEQANYELILNEFLETPISFADANLEEVIRNQVGIYDRSLYSRDVNLINCLDAGNYSISDLTGIENLVNLTHLYLQFNNITDITPLINLENLEYVILNGNIVASTPENQAVYDFFIENHVFCDNIPDDHGNTMETSTEIDFTTSQYSGMISPSGDVDYFNFTITETTSIVLYTVSSLDTVGTLYGSSGLEIAYSDDNNISLDFLIEINLNPGVYYLCVCEFGSDSGTYNLYYERIT